MEASRLSAGSCSPTHRLVVSVTFSQYTIREFDSESGLYYYRARYYDPNVGRFLTEDGNRHESQSSLYAYVDNNPTVFVDPSGLVARLYCEPIGLEGRAWYEKLVLWSLDPYHCYLYVSCHGSGHYLEIYGPGPEDPKHGRPHNDQPLNLDRAKKSTEYPITPPAGMGCCEFENRLDQAFNKESASVPEYQFLGPNSNTFAQSLITSAGGSVSPPPGNAPGWGWKPPTPKP